MAAAVVVGGLVGLGRVWSDLYQVSLGLIWVRSDFWVEKLTQEVKDQRVYLKMLYCGILQRNGNDVDDVRHRGISVGRC